METIRLAHISDLHFSNPTFNLLHLFSKRWLGNLNLLLSRKKNFNTKQLLSLIDFFTEQKVTHIVISGDLTTTSSPEEMSLALHFVGQLKEKGFHVFTLPGNHDHYTRSAYRTKIFYNYFPSSYGEKKFNLNEDGVTYTSLMAGWWLIALDTTLATSWVSSQGVFSEKVEENLKRILALIPKEDSIILTNHFPLFENDSPRKALLRSKELRNLMKCHPNIKFYLHGHTHRHSLTDLRGWDLPIILDSGCTSHKELGKGNILTISSQDCSVNVFAWNEAWTIIGNSSYALV